MERRVTEAIISTIGTVRPALGRRELDSRALITRALTTREAEVLDLISCGLSDREIGQCLQISSRTASTHVAHILEKLDATGRAHAVALGYRRGLLLLEPRDAAVSRRPFRTARLDT